MSKLLFHPHITLAATISAAISCGIIATSLVAAITPLAHDPNLVAIAPYIARADAVLATVAGVCTAVAGVGRSFLPAVDAGPSS